MSKSAPSKNRQRTLFDYVQRQEDAPSVTPVTLIVSSISDRQATPNSSFKADATVVRYNEIMMLHLHKSDDMNKVDIDAAVIEFIAEMKGEKLFLAYHKLLLIRTMECLLFSQI